MNLQEKYRLIEGYYRKALAEKRWIEAISLAYTVLEVAFWVLLEVKEVADEKISKEDYLLGLADLAKDEGFINGDIYRQVKEFNKTRALAVHHFLRFKGEKISYDGIGKALEGVDKLFQGIIRKARE